MHIILLYSGGLDSTVALYHFLAEGHSLQGLGIHYGQRHKKELESAKQIMQALAVPYQTIDLSALKPFLAGNSQTGDLDVPEGHYTEEAMKLTIVPNRNMIMLSIAIGWAISLKYNAVAYAAHAGDHTIYPDCRPKFIQTMQEAAKLCDWNPVLLLAPFSKMKKEEIVRLGSSLKVPFEKTWSCYKGLTKHCGQCGTCVERKEAFFMAQVQDPTLYEDES